MAGRRVGQVVRTRDAMQQVADDVRRLSPDTVVLLSPHAPLSPYSMGVVASDRYTGGFESFGAASVRLSASGDAELVSALAAECRATGVPLNQIGRQGESYHLDHGASVPLFFLREAGVRCNLVLLAFSALDVTAHLRFGRAIAAAVGSSGRRAVFVASGDLSHRLAPGAPAGFSPRGREFDEMIVSALKRRDLDAIVKLDADLLSEAGECGYRSMVVALGALRDPEIDVLSYECPFGVGYLVARLRVNTLPLSGASSSAAAISADDLSQDDLEILRLARLAVETHVREGRAPSVPLSPRGLLAERAGVFVSLKVDGRLRGCIGTFQPTEPAIAAEIVRNAVAAASRDPRFLPICSAELPALEYSVDILSPPEPVDDLSQLDPTRYGVIVQSGARRGLLLPDLEGVSTVRAQIDIAQRKAGISPGADIQLYRFSVKRVMEAGSR